MTPFFEIGAHFNRLLLCAVSGRLVLQRPSDSTGLLKETNDHRHLLILPLSLISFFSFHIKNKKDTLIFLLDVGGLAGKHFPLNSY